jgi:PilZ domain
VIKENRKSERQRHFLRGFVRILETNTTIDCIVRDISETGAKLRFRCTTPMPELFELHIPSKGQFAKSKLVWNKNCEVGISFESLGAFGSPPLSDGEMSARMARLEDEITALKQTLKQLQKRVDQTKAA